MEDPCTYVYLSERGIILVLCQHQVPDERAVEWSQVLFSKIKRPQSCLILGQDTYLGNHVLRGLSDSAAFLLCSKAGYQTLGTKQRVDHIDKEHASTTCRVPFLPSGIILPGLVSALITYAEALNIPAFLVLQAMVHPLPDSMAMGELAKAMAEVMTIAGFDASLSQSILSGQKAAGEWAEKKRADRAQRHVFS